MPAAKSKSRTSKRRAPKAPSKTLSKADRLAARYDSAQTTDENSRHWANSDHLSARSALDPSVRRTLRIRSRYEVANCPLARSILRKLADFTVGTGPRLQVKTPDREYNRAVMRAFRLWTIATGWSRKLWLMRYAKAMNGESFAVFFTNPPLRTQDQPVTLDLRMVEADQVADPSMTSARNNGSDGIIFDDFGNPAGYRILTSHPGDTLATGTLPSDFETFSAENVAHYFSSDRAGQVRGVPEITAGLPYLAMRRRYILAVLGAAETAADLAGVITTQSSPEDPDDLEPLDAIEIERRMLMTLPAGWTANQFKPEQPTTTLDMFDRVIIREIGRCVNMPYGIAAGDSSPYNFASGKLDHLPWFQTVRIEQDHIEDVLAEPTFVKWFDEASRIAGYLPAPMFDAPVPDHQWFWDGQDLLDPREAGAKQTGLSAGFETHGRIAARRGEDILDEWEAESELLGITLDEYRNLVIKSVFSGAISSEPEQEEEGATTDG